MIIPMRNCTVYITTSLNKRNTFKSVLRVITLKKIETARQLCENFETMGPVKFDENFARPMVFAFEGPFATPYKMWQC